MHDKPKGVHSKVDISKSLKCIKKALHFLNRAAKGHFKDFLKVILGRLKIKSSC